MKKILLIILISLFSLTVISCSSSDGDSSTTSTTSDDTTTTTITLSTTLADVIYKVITVKKEPKDHSIKYTSRTDKPTTTTGFGGITLASTLNFDNAQFGNSKFQ